MLLCTGFHGRKFSLCIIIIQNWSGEGKKPFHPLPGNCKNKLIHTQMNGSRLLVFLDPCGP